MKIDLNPSLDLNSLTTEYAIDKRLQIRDFLVEQSANEIYGKLNQLPWGLTYNEGQQVHELALEQVKNLTPTEIQEIGQKVQSGAAEGYQFLYNYYPLLARYFDRALRHEEMFDVFEFVNSPAFLNFVRKLTGLDDILWADAHATLYRAGHFLKFHTDESPTEKRLAAYVLNFTRDWGRDWGGLLQFWDKKYDVELAYRPIFNGLNIFTIPADHSVSMVTSYCPGMRFSVTGWLRGDALPQSIPFRS